MTTWSAREREGECAGCGDPLHQVERSPTIWRPLLCDDCLHGVEGPMVTIRCPDCARSDEAGEMVKIPASVRYDLIRFEARRPGDRIYLCDQCTVCGTLWCVKVLRPAA